METSTSCEQRERERDCWAAVWAQILETLCTSGPFKTVTNDGDKFEDSMQILVLLFVDFNAWINKIAKWNEGNSVRFTFYGARSKVLLNRGKNCLRHELMIMLTNTDITLEHRTHIVLKHNTITPLVIQKT